MSAAGKELFEQWIDAELVQDPVASRKPHAYHGRYPYATVRVHDFDSVTRFLELKETLYLQRTESVDLESIPLAERQGDFSIQVSDAGFKFKYAIYGFHH